MIDAAEILETLVRKTLGQYPDYQERRDRIQNDPKIKETLHASVIFGDMVQMNNAMTLGWNDPRTIMNSTPVRPAMSQPKRARPTKPEQTPTPAVLGLSKEDLEPYCRVKATATIQEPMAVPRSIGEAGSTNLPSMSTATSLPVFPLNTSAPSTSWNCNTTSPLDVFSLLSVPPELLMLQQPAVLPHNQQILPPPTPITLPPNYLLSLLLSGGLPSTFPSTSTLPSDTSSVVESTSPPKAKRRKFERVEVPLREVAPMPIGSPMPSSSPASTTSTSVSHALTEKDLESPLELLGRMAPRDVVPPSSISENDSSLPKVLWYENRMKNFDWNFLSNK